jgi:D-alanyl-lipoteichoic acid acyltransferase DltB (MBOAT superfamily)
MLGAINNPVARWRWTAVAIVLLVGLFTAGRLLHWDKAVFMAGTHRVGLGMLDMWLTLRLVTLFWEVGSGAVTLPSPAAYAGWVALPMTLSGPIVRYSELPSMLVPNPSLWRSPAWWREVAEGGVKFVAGILLAASPALIATQRGAELAGGVMVVFVTAPMGFYLTFAGYYHLMQAFAAPAGIALPDSFNWPMGRENVSAFWANWNMTATRVFRDYLFYNRWGLRRHNVYANTLALFLLMGMWHGANAYWLLFGILHGVMFSGFLAWRRWKAAHGMRGAPAPWSAVDIAGRVVTYIAVCAAWYVPSKILHWLGVI